MFWTERINGPQDHYHHHGRDRCVMTWNTKISDTRPCAQGRSNDEIRNQQKRTNRSEKSALLARCRIDPAAIGKMGADDNVIETHDCREGAYGENDRERCETSRDKRQPEHIGLAGTPIAVKQRGGAPPINVARPMDARGNNFGHRYEPSLSVALALACKFFLRPPGLIANR